MEYPIRINKYLRDKGFASRREADQLIAEGKVFVNNRRAETGMMIGQNDKVVLRQRKPKELVYLAYYKPRGLATQDFEDFESVIKEWKNKGLFPVGRLDKESEGLLILTNDGRATAKLTDPKSRLEKEYIVNVKEKLRGGLPAIFAKGMQTKTFGRLLPAKARLIDKQTLRVILLEGKRHQIRVMLSELDYTIASLKRIRIGNILIGSLKPGQTRQLTPKEYENF